MSFLLNAVLLFVVAFFVYPLKFLSTLLINGIRGYREMDAAGNATHAMQRQDWRPLMQIYGAGFINLYVIFALLYLHACRLRDALELNPMEVYETRGVMQENVLMTGIGSLAVVLAFMNRPQLSGMTYALIGPLHMWLGSVHARRRKTLSGLGVKTAAAA